MLMMMLQVWFCIVMVIHGESIIKMDGKMIQEIALEKNGMADMLKINPIIANVLPTAEVVMEEKVQEVETSIPELLQPFPIHASYPEYSNWLSTSGVQANVRNEKSLKKIF